MTNSTEIAKHKGQRNIAATVSKAPQGSGRGATASKNSPCISEPLLFSARHGSKNPGFVLRPLSPFPLCHCLVGCCLYCFVGESAKGCEGEGERLSKRHHSTLHTTLVCRHMCDYVCVLYSHIHVYIC